MLTDKDIQQAYAEMELTGREILTGWRQRGQVNYRDAFMELGARGQFSDIWRKIQKLKHAVWEGRPLVGEQAEQIAAEIIPHCLMLIYLLRHQGIPISGEFYKVLNRWWSEDPVIEEHLIIQIDNQRLTLVRGDESQAWMLRETEIQDG